MGYSSDFYGAVEMGGTNINCAIFSHKGENVRRVSFQTRKPEETLIELADFFLKARRDFGDLKAIGVGCFGPVDLDPKSSKYGYITGTPKKSWSWTNVVGILQDLLQTKIYFTTDVNAAALGEGAYGAAQGHQNFVYVTVGTGVGAGLVLNGKLVQGVTHPEVGHLLMPSKDGKQTHSGGCAFHGSKCLEGMAAGPAMAKRWGVSSAELKPDHPAWEEQAFYLAVLCNNLCAFIAPEKIILSGGVMQQQQLFPLVRSRFADVSNDYFHYLRDFALDSFIVPSSLNGDAGLLGAFELAKLG